MQGRPGGTGRPHILPAARAVRSPSSQLRCCCLCRGLTLLPLGEQTHRHTHCPHTTPTPTAEKGLKRLGGERAKKQPVTWVFMV